uniref:NADH dehydrogenase subunit 6 n=1 Tax=Haemonchus contortus TaxID=6289 RepID=B1P8R9_HAECO|nr:NADH dehydrogenase subunit 6 [Haemonchus contortus]ABY64772.1 NADH dehydrogenase subunit 6 [Haemonchus contortus]
MVMIMVAMLMSVLSYLSVDPMKSSFFLILTLLLSMPVLSFSGNVWFVYFVCLLFLSGIFVILVYFSSLSSVKYKKMYFVNLLGFMLLMIGVMMVMLKKDLDQSMVGMNEFYYNVYWLMLIFILLTLLLFMSFVSYYLNFSGALRKI